MRIPCAAFMPPRHVFRNFFCNRYAIEACGRKCAALFADHGDSLQCVLRTVGSLGEHIYECMEIELVVRAEIEALFCGTEVSHEACGERILLPGHPFRQ